MSQESIQCDIAVVGGGPAGSSIATLLARKGYDVLLIEKDHHPRFHIGESLLPLTIPYLKQLGVLEEVEHIGIRKYAAEFHSMYHRKSTSFEFAEALDPDYPYAFEVRRSDFDALLFDQAKKSGAQTQEGCEATEVHFEGDRIATLCIMDEQGNPREVMARFFIDATGRDTLLSKKLGWKEKNPRHASAALYGHFENARRNEGIAEGNISIYWFDYGWFWFIPLKDGQTSIGAVCHPTYMKTRKTTVEQFFNATIQLCPDLAERLREARLVSPVTATGNYSYRSRKMYGDNYLLIGDAFTFIDPVFSSGVHLALNSAFSGAEAVDQSVKNPSKHQSIMRQLEREISGGLSVFSWFIYRITTPAIRDLFMAPRNVWGVKSAIISVLAGDLFRQTPIGTQIFIFKLIYWIKVLSAPRKALFAHRNRRKNMGLSA